LAGYICAGDQLKPQSLLSSVELISFCDAAAATSSNEIWALSLTTFEHLYNSSNSPSELGIIEYANIDLVHLPISYQTLMSVPSIPVPAAGGSESNNSFARLSGCQGGQSDFCSGSCPVMMFNPSSSKTAESHNEGNSTSLLQELGRTCRAILRQALLLILLVAKLYALPLIHITRASAMTGSSNVLATFDFLGFSIDCVEQQRHINSQ